MDALDAIIMIVTVLIVGATMALVVASAWRRQKYELVVSIGLFSASLGLVTMVFGELLYLEVATSLLAGGMALACLSIWAKLRTVPKD